MHLVQLLLPLYAKPGVALPRARFAQYPPGLPRAT